MKISNKRVVTVSCFWLCFWLGLTCLKAQILGGMLDPAMDVEGEPFSYFWHPTDVIGALYAPVASEVTPEGYICTGFGELMFYVENPPVPVNQRIKTLYKGYLPIVQYQFCRDGVRYQFAMFGAELGSGLKGLPVNFVKVELHNETRQKRAAFLSSAYRFTAPIDKLGGLADYRFRQRSDLIPSKYTEGQTQFNPDWQYGFGQNTLLRDGRILYQFPNEPKPHQVSLALGDTGLRAVRYFTGEVRVNEARHRLDPHTPMGVVMYRVPLEPGESRSLVFKVPIVPIPEGTLEAAQVKAANYEEEFEKTVSTWEELVMKRSPLLFPEAKVQEYLLANTIFDLLAIDEVEGDYIINVNKFQYHRFYPGNGSNMIVALDYMGLEDIAKKCFLYARKVQFPDGSLRNLHRPERESFEITAYVIWSWTRHYLLTRDEAFLQEVYPGIQAAVGWMKEITGKDPLGLMPPATVADDAMLANVRQTGMSLWALIALKHAIRMAEAVKNQSDTKAFQEEYQRYRDAFEEHLSSQVEKSGGFIPPALERTLDGNRWDDLLLLYPEPLFEPFDSRVSATIEDSRATYAEGILGFGWQHAVGKTGGADWPEMALAGIKTVTDKNYIFNDTRMLHYWQTPNNAQNALVRGTADDQEWAVKDLYALLLHTSSTHAPQEFGTVPWSTRDYWGVHNILPDGAASAKTIELLRNMLVREYQNDLYLFSALSPAWLQPGQRIEVIDQPTEFGPVSLVSKVNSNLATWNWEVTISHRFREAPERLVMRLPWFYEVEAAEVEGGLVEPENGELQLSSETRQIRLRGRIRPGTEALSFDRAVEQYVEEYGERFREFVRTGITSP